MGRLTLATVSRETVAAEPGTVVEKVFPTRKQPMGIKRVRIETFCSMCGAQNIDDGIQIWRGKGALKERQNYHVICVPCARRIGKAAE